MKRHMHECVKVNGVWMDKQQAIKGLTQFERQNATLLAVLMIVLAVLFVVALLGLFLV
jgi:hypothetical protein